MSEQFRAIALLAMLTVACASCAMVGPDYKPPTAALGSAWATSPGGGAEASRDAESAWWKTLGDPQLDGLITRAITRNTDVRRALAQLRAARAARGEATAALFPTLGSSAQYERRRSAGTASSGASPEFNTFAAGFDSSWEIDVFGGLRRAREQRAAEFEAAGADLHGVLVSTLAEVALNYVELRSLQERIAIADRNARSQKDTLDLVRWRFRAGLVGALDVNQADYNLADTRSRIPALETSRAAASNRIAVLLGQEAGSLDAELATAKPVPPAPTSVAVGMPVDLLRRRPDIVAAERRLEAATAAVGVAKADLYPKLTLSGTFSIAATDLARLDSAAARAFSVGPTLRWNVFDAGRIRSLVAQRSAETDAALASWESVVLVACEETENALVAYAREQQRRDDLSQARDAARHAQELARLQYQNGLVDFQRVLDAERAALGFEESFAISSAAVATNLVAVYKALGGGWQRAECDDDGCRERLSGTGP